MEGIMDAWCCDLCNPSWLEACDTHDYTNTVLGALLTQTLVDVVLR